MALNKLKFNSINVTPAANEALKFNSSANGFETESAGGAMTVIKKLTASSDSTLSFVDGSSDVVLDNTYKEYIFIFNNIHGSTNQEFRFQVSTDSGSNYGVNITSSCFESIHGEDDSFAQVAYQSDSDLAQSTSFQNLIRQLGTDNDNSAVGILHLFNPSSTTFVKHFIANFQTTVSYHISEFTAGYINTTSAIDAIQFKMDSGNIDAGTITLYGIN
jgi:hypothetical protein